jgi:C1A family cysteine protease
VTEEFTGPTNGYVPYNSADPTTSLGGHAVHLVGYIDNSALAANPATASAPPGAGGGYFLVKNSWGTCAGDVGYYYVPVTYFQAEIGAAYGVSQETN